MIEHYIKLKTALSLCTGVIVAVILLACQVRRRPVLRLRNPPASS
jgi:hypothetical protein